MTARLEVSTRQGARHRLLLVNPAQPGHKRWNWTRLVTLEPLGLACVAALTPPDWEVRIADELVDQLPSDHDFRPDLVGITSLTPSAPRAYEVAAHFRERGVPVVMGGIHATLCPDEAARYVDVVVRGEAEGAWPQLISDFCNGRLRSRYDGGAPELTEMAPPKRDLYRHRYGVALVSTSRGCRYRCEFCSVWKFGRFRARPVEDVLEELQTMSPGVTMFADDNIMSDRDHALALFRAMATRGLRRRHAVQASLNIADDDELLDALKSSGCFLVFVGLESVNEAALKSMRKGVNLNVGVQHYQEKITRLHAHGLMAAATFIFGNDGDTPDIFERTARFVLEAGVDLAWFYPLMPCPGTDLFDRLSREGRLLLTDLPSQYALLDTNHVAFIPRTMSERELEAGLAYAYEAITRLPVALRRAARTWRDTGSLWAAVASLMWTRTALYRRVFGL